MAGSACPNAVRNLPLAISWLCFPLYIFILRWDSPPLVVSWLPSAALGLYPTSGAPCPQKKEISFPMVLAKTLVLTLMASAMCYLFLNQSQWSIGWRVLIHHAWVTCLPLDLEEGGVSPILMTRPESRGWVLSHRQIKCYYQKKGQILFRQKAVLSISLPDLMAYESKQILLLFFCICEDCVQVWW